MDAYVSQAAGSAARFGEPAPRAHVPEPVVRVGQLMRLLRRHLWLIVLLAVISAAAAFGYAHTLPKTFTANSTLAVEGSRFAIPELQGALRTESSPDPMPWVRTDVQAITSRAAVQAVISELHLARDPEFNPTLRPPTLMERVKGTASALMADLFPKPAGDNGAAASEDELVLGEVEQKLAVFQDNRSLVISISFTARDPKVASDFVNALIEQFIQSRTKRNDAANQGASAVMTQRIGQVRDDLAKIEQKMTDLRNKNEIVTLRAGGVGQQQLEELTTEAARATLARTQLETTYDRALAAAKQGSSDELTAVLNSPTITALREREALASQRVAELSAHYGPSYPAMRSASAEVATARRQLNEEAARIVASLGDQLRAARDQEASVLQQLAQARQAGVIAEDARAQLDQLKQEAATQRTLYQSLLSQAQQTAAQPAAISSPDVHVLSPAVPPGLPSGPNTKLAALMGGSGGALLGCLIAMARLRSVRGFETQDALAGATGIPVLASLPRGLVELRRGVLGEAGRTDGSDAEAMRMLRARLHLAGRTEAPRVIVFVPPVAGEAAESATAALTASLARVAAADGERALLIEGDTQTPRVGRLLGRSPGQRRNDLGEVEDWLDGDRWQDAVSPDRQAGLDLLLASDAIGHAQGSFATVDFVNLLVEARADYDLVIVRSPPAGVPDAAILAQRADATVLVVDSRLDHAAVQDATTHLGEASGSPLVAVLLTKA